MADKNARGWGFPALSRKAHYFVDGTALCGGWAFTGELHDTMHDHKDNCRACMRKREAKTAKERQHG